MARSNRHPGRLLVAVTVSTMLATFLLYTSLAGGATPSLQPGQLAGHPGKVDLAGKVIGPISGDARNGAGLSFLVQDIDGEATVPVRYRGTVPDLFRVGRHIFVSGRLRDGVFVAAPNTLMTKCPSKYESAKQES
jgi:cytochrome c-type biogenesis protein CcmE